MGIAVMLILILAAVIVGWIDTYGVQRDYADLYAARHGHIPPLVDWFFKRDTDPEVDDLRRLHRNLLLSSVVLVAVAVLLALWLQSSPSG
jgi:uncharacterized Tic20 family protein